MPTIKTRPIKPRRYRAGARGGDEGRLDTGGILGTAGLGTVWVIPRPMVYFAG